MRSQSAPQSQEGSIARLQSIRTHLFSNKQDKMITSNKSWIYKEIDTKYVKNSIQNPVTKYNKNS